MEIYGNNTKGLFLNADDTHAPYYFDGTNGYRLLTTNDLKSNLQQIFNAFIPNISSYVTSPANTAFTAPASGWIWTQGYFSAAGGQVVTMTINGEKMPNIGYNNSSTYNFDSPLWFPVFIGDTIICNREIRFYRLR